MPAGRTFGHRTVHDRAGLSLSRHDRAEQVVTYQHVTLDQDGMHLRPFKMRYVWPSELDLMAQLAGLQLSLDAPPQLGTVNTTV